MSSFPSVEKPPILLHEDSKYALQQLLSIITVDDYEDLSNHETEAMRETSLFCIAQVTSQPSTLLSVYFTFRLLYFSSTYLVTNSFHFQAMLMMKGLIGCCLNHETALDRLRTKATLMEDELNELKSWKVVQEKKLSLSEEARCELEKQMELLQKVLVDKEKEITEAKDWLFQVKEEAIHEYRDSDALLAELGGLFTEGFDNCLR